VTWGHCPHCGVDIEKHLRSVWDYQSQFDTTCPRCGESIGVDVQSTPEFCCDKVTNAARDKAAWERARARAER